MSDEKKITLIDVLTFEIQGMAKRSKELRDTITSAKTTPKKTLYTKKLKKHNRKLGEMLVALDKLQKKKESEIIIERSTIGTLTPPDAEPIEIQYGPNKR